MSFYIIFSAPVLLKRGSDRVVGTWQPAVVLTHNILQETKNKVLLFVCMKERNYQIYGILGSDNKALLLQNISSTLFS